jgi:hypothetical protein
MRRNGWLAAVATSLAVGSLGLVAARGDEPTVEVATVADQIGNLPTKQELAAEDRSVSPETLDVRQSVEVGGIVWTVVSYDSSDGPCLDVYADTGAKSDPGQSGCGESSGPFNVSIGGQEIGGRWYNIAYGAAVPGAATASIESTGGSQNVDVVDGTWLSVVPGETLDYAGVALKDDSGEIVAAVDLPSLAAQRQTEVSLAASAETSSEAP